MNVIVADKRQKKNKLGRKRKRINRMKKVSLFVEKHERETERERERERERESDWFGFMAYQPLLAI